MLTLTHKLIPDCLSPSVQPVWHILLSNLLVLWCVHVVSSAAMFILCSITSFYCGSRDGAQRFTSNRQVFFQLNYTLNS